MELRSLHHVKPVHVAVIGAGVIGLSVAVELAQLAPSHNLFVTLISEKLSPHTTSELSGGFVMPPSLQKGPEAASRDVVERRVRVTFERLHALYKSPRCKEAGLSLVHGFLAKLDSLPWWRDIVFGFRPANEHELAMLPHQGKPVYSFSSYMLQCRTYIPWLLQQFTNSGSVIVQAKVNNLSELSSFDFVINCTGLAAAELVDDPNVYPIAGQLVCVKAPWIKIFYHEVLTFDNCKERTHIFPLTDYIILGGTFIPDCISTVVDDETTDGILKRCQDVVPSLCNAEILDAWVGIRPARKGGMRLEKESGVSKPTIIHCYGHGHIAMALSWGCAEEIAKMVTNHATVQKLVTSKL